MYKTIIENIIFILYLYSFTKYFYGLKIVTIFKIKVTNWFNIKVGNQYS